MMYGSERQFRRVIKHAIMSLRQLANPGDVIYGQMDIVFDAQLLTTNDSHRHQHKLKVTVDKCYILLLSIGYFSCLTVVDCIFQLTSNKKS